MAQQKLVWQSKTVLLVVLPFVAASVVLETHWWAVNDAQVAIWTTGLSLILGAVAFKLHSATLGAAGAGAAITASMMYSTTMIPYAPWNSALVPMLAVLVQTSVVTHLGRSHKEQLGTAESRRGRSASQVAANLGVAALISNDLTQSLLAKQDWLQLAAQAPSALFAVGLSALAEAAADTVSSELGQVLSNRPRMLTTLRRVEPGTDGAISVAGTLAGVVAAGLVAAAGALAFRGGVLMLAVSWTAAVFGLFFDSLLGATLERRGWLNNDAVNFLSTASAVAFALGLLAILPRI